MVLSLLCAFLVICSLPVLSQERFGNVTGVVTDASGAVVPDVTVTVTNKSTNRVFTAKTRNDGTFNANDLEPGRYSLLFQKTGFSRYEVPDVMVMVGRTVNVQAQLKVGGVDQKVEVVEAAPVIDTSSNIIATNVTVEELDRIPKGRSFEGVAVLAPSVNTGFADGGYQINGASAAENAYYVDGVATNSVIDGSARQGSTFDYLQEVQVKTTGLDAEYGGALGGVVSAITKSGGNEFHGDLHYYYYGNKLNAAPTERLAVSRTTATPGPYPMAYFQDGKWKNDNHEFGGSIGGPILKDKLWFYTAASPRWQSRTNYYQFTDTFGPMSRSFNQQNWFNKVSWDPISRIRTNFTFLYTPQTLKGSLYGYNEFGPNGVARDYETAKLDGNLGSRQFENSYTGQVDITLTNSTLLSVKGGRYYLNYKDTGVDFTRRWVWSGSSQGLAGVPPSLQQPDGFATPTAAQTAHDLTTRTYVQADLSQVVRFAGQHNFKFGFGTQKSVNNVLDSSAPDGLITLFWAQQCEICVSAGGQAGATPYGYYTVDDLGTIGTAGSSITHFYVQDSWKIGGRLTINAGFRTEKELIPSFRPDIKKYAIEFGYGDKLAPRIGGSFDLLGNGKVKISAGWGRYFDWTKYDLPRGTFGADRWWTFYRTIDDPNQISSISLGNLPGTNLWVEDHQDWRLPGFDTLDPGVKPMSSDAMNAGVEWEFRNNMVFTGRYVRTHLNRTIEDMGVLVNGSESYFYGNPGEGQNTEAPSCYVGGVPTCTIPMPKARRDYDAMELSVNKRFGGGWLGNVSYVYSRLYGNYSGLQSTDEILPSTYGAAYSGNQAFAGQTYRPGGNANRYFDLDQAFVDSHGNTDILGRLPTDRPHVLKFYGAKQFKFGTEVGGFFRVQSGTPITTQVYTTQGIPIYVEGRGDLGREPVFSQTDLLVAHNFKVGEKKALRFEMNIQNLFNQKTNIYTYQFYNRRDHRSSTGLRVTNGVVPDFRNGFDWQGLLTSQAATRGQIVDRDPRYGQPAEFNPGFNARFQVKFTF
ncbi:MAG TPA: TonB-dependent receptor [Terriglobales bacterium]|nr:TonB-dependent receptor [Terriglobales bacterium]